jgi:hypothetical protein
MARRLSHLMALAAVSLLIPASASGHVQAADNSIYLSLGPRSSVFTGHGEAFAFSDAVGRSTSYSTRARATRRGLVADFGRLGRIELEFEASGPPTEQKPTRFCHGEPQLTWEGVYTGTVELAGRYGFRQVRDLTFEKKGTFTHTPRTVCHIPGEKRPAEPADGNGVLLWAASCDGSGFSAQGERPRSVPDTDQPDPVSYSADSTLRLGPVQVAQSFTVHAAPGTFSFDEGLTTATVSPPAPFHGTGTLVRAADGTTAWSGSLSATILGRQVSLAGSGFESELQSFPKLPGTAYAFLFSTSCPDNGASVSGNPLLTPHLGPLLPSIP